MGCWVRVSWHQIPTAYWMIRLWEGCFSFLSLCPIPVNGNQQQGGYEDLFSVKSCLHMLSCFEQGTGHPITANPDGLLIFLCQFFSLKLSTCLVRAPPGKNGLQAHSFLQEWILSPHIWSSFANRHKYSVIALKCAGNNTANCSLGWLRRCSETERVRAAGGCKALSLSHCDSRCLRAPMFTGAFTAPHPYATTWPKDTWVFLTSLRQNSWPSHLLHTLLPTDSLVIPSQDHLKRHLFRKAFPDDPYQYKWLLFKSPAHKTLQAHPFLYTHLTF